MNERGGKDGRPAAYPEPGSETRARREARSGDGALPRRSTVTLNGDLLWPVLITVGLLVVVLVNVLFIYVAVNGADSVAPSYILGER